MGPASANLQVFDVAGRADEQIDHVARRAGGEERDWDVVAVGTCNRHPAGTRRSHGAWLRVRKEQRC